MKTVFSPSELPHIWARQTQEEGRNSSNNFYFKGDTIYSHGRHFPIAKILPSGVVLFTSQRFSKSTAKQIAYVRQAVRHKEVVYCYNPEYNAFENVQQEINLRIRTLKDDVENTRKRPHTRAAAAQEIDAIVSRCKLICTTRGTTLEVVMKEMKKSSQPQFHLNLAILNWALDREGFDYSGVVTKIEKAVSKARAEYEKKAKKKAAENLALWLDNKLSTYSLNQQYTPVMLRMYSDKIIETTKGARVSYKSAQLLYSMIKAGKDIIGHDIDGYTVISLNGVLKIGCHEIHREEINRFATLMNW